MNIIKKVFRNPASDILFMTGLVIACVILINISNLASKSFIEEETISKYEYSLRYSMTIKDEVAQEVINCFDKYERGNIYFTHHVHINRESDSIYTHVLMAQNEKLRLDFKEGGYDTDSQYENAVIIGESLERYITEESGKKYIELDTMLYNVIGILENNMSAQKDTTIFALWDTMTQDRKEQWIKLGFASGEKQLLYESNKHDMAYFEQVMKLMNEGSLKISYIDGGRHISDGENEAYIEINEMLLGIGLIFSVFTCFSVSHLWLMNRRKELAVRFAHGYSSQNIFNLLFKDTMNLLIPTFVVAIVVQWLYSMYVSTGSILEGKILLKLAVVFGGVLLIVLINTLYLMFSMRKFKTVMLNEDK